MTTTSCQFVDMYATGGKTMGIYYESDSRGSCYNSSYGTDDPFVKSARAMIVISILSGGLGGFLVLLDWIFFDFNYAGAFQAVAFSLAWSSAAVTFIFYGAKVCQKDSYEGFYDLMSSLAASIEGELSGCKFSQSSTYMVVAAVIYFICGFLLCWYVLFHEDLFVGYYCLIVCGFRTNQH